MIGDMTQISIQVTQVHDRFDASSTARGARASSHVSARAAAEACAAMLAEIVHQPLQKVTPFSSDELVWIATFGEAFP